MKSYGTDDKEKALKSPLAMAEWIEIFMKNKYYHQRQSPLAMAEWIEMFWLSYLITVLQSPLAMAEWIEILHVQLSN